jgi:hypothetical protein
MSGVHVASGSVAGLPSLPASRIACHGRQKSQWYLSFQQLMIASAPARFIIANRRRVELISPTSARIIHADWRRREKTELGDVPYQAATSRAAAAATSIRK